MVLRLDNNGCPARMLLALACLVVGFGSGFLVREFISQRRRLRERERRYSASGADNAPASAERRLEPLSESERPFWGAAD
jgi:hypothetical protein